LILEEELREPETYFQILEAISFGYTKVVEIANYSYLQAKDVSSYLSVLEDIGFVKKEHSVLDKRRIRGIYRMKDNFFEFWFRFISRYFSEIETWAINGAWSNFKREFNSYLGFTFEKIAVEYLVEEKPFGFHRIGRWWHKGKEIDLVALNEETKGIAFFEVKWSDLKLEKARKILEELEDKSEFVNWNNEERTEYFGLIAKGLEGKEELMEEGYLCYDLEDIQ
jgi:AAA+ ATPase superfamily predicted ATPase